MAHQLSLCPASCLLAGWAVLTPALAAQASDPELAPPPATVVFLANRASASTIEHAWLADPVTFPYPLKVRSTAQGFELTGLVPSAVISDRALALAQQAASTPVVNRIVIVPNMAMAFPAAQGPAFGDEARERLEQVSPIRGRQLELRARKDGQLILTGRADSEEQKLEFARALRGLPGATSVVNNMVVTAAGAATPASSPTPLPLANGPQSQPKSPQPEALPMPQPRPLPLPLPADHGATGGKDGPRLNEPIPVERPRLQPPRGSQVYPKGGKSAIVLFD
ncbi:MAG TPA: BON domain-containing protein [Gemmatales bacterium]|nr:BON domain-containing protein [Gemmatales bacterium]